MSPPVVDTLGTLSNAATAGRTKEKAFEIHLECFRNILVMFVA